MALKATTTPGEDGERSEQSNCDGCDVPSRTFQSSVVLQRPIHPNALGGGVLSLAAATATSLFFWQWPQACPMLRVRLSCTAAHLPQSAPHPSHSNQLLRSSFCTSICQSLRSLSSGRVLGCSLAYFAYAASHRGFRSRHSLQTMASAPIGFLRAGVDRTS